METKGISLLSVAFSLLLSCMGQAFGQDDKRLLVFLLAGQSNMEGQGVVDLDHPDHYNGGKGILNKIVRDQPERWGFLKSSDGQYREQEDVGIRFLTRHGLKRGFLSVGFTGYDGKHHIGPELAFGHVVGRANKEPILLIKTAWGGKSLMHDFRPPSAAGSTGEYYQKMLNEFEIGLNSIPKEFPQWKAHQVEVSGFVWQQGWNDMVNSEATEAYADNLTHLIQDVRRALNRPQLPVVIGELGNMGPDAGEGMKKFRAAQRLGASARRLGDRVRFVETASFARPREESPNTGHGHHWFGNAESYLLVGEALGKAMVELQNQP